MSIRAICAAVIATTLSGCYVLPMTPEGRPAYVVGADGSFTPNAGVPAGPGVVAAPGAPVTLVAKLYPANDVAARAGVLTGTVTNHLGGKGEFRFDLGGEMVLGEATRVDGDSRRGVASGYGSRGTYMSCDYQLTSPTFGTGACSLSSGAKYQLHFGQ